MLEIEMASRTGQGQRTANEDSLCFGRAASGWYAVVADGAGGHRRGAEASSRTVRVIEALIHSASEAAFTPETLSRIVIGAHYEVQRHQSSADPAAAMHSTVVVLWIDHQAKHALWAHVGDSRLYRIRHGLVDVVTNDDSLVQQMVSAGLITREQARQHPHKNQLVAALGIQGEIDPHTVVRPIELKPGDAFLLCSDGWWDCFNRTSIEAALERARSADEWVSLMAGRIDDQRSPRQDNFSCVAVWAGNPKAGMEDSPDDTVPRARRG